MFTHPIKNPERIANIPNTIPQLRALIRGGGVVKVVLVLWNRDPGWMLTVEKDQIDFASAVAEGTEIRIYRTLAALKDHLADLEIPEIEVPINSDKLIVHTNFVEERATFIQKKMKEQKLTNAIVGDRLNAHNAYVSQAISGQNHRADICAELAEICGLTPSELFPEIENQLL